VKAKAVVGIALALRCGHSLELLHGAVKASNVLFDADQRIQIADFSPIRPETSAVQPFSAEGSAPTVDISAFASLLFGIAVDRLLLRPSLKRAVRLSLPLFRHLFRG
jgi:serine/threonine protein kinase